MLEALKPILKIQDLDIKMIRLMRMKRQRLDELSEVESVHKELRAQLEEKQKDLASYDKEIQTIEDKVSELTAKLKKLDDQQNSIKKVEEFNAMTHEMTAIEREKIALEHKALEVFDKKTFEEELLEKIKESIVSSQDSSVLLKDEINANIALINEEGTTLKKERAALATTADPAILSIYERLLRNKKDRVLVPIENRTCSGCHIVLTIQHENLVRKGDNMVFCEHCSRIHYWPEEVLLQTEDEGTGPTKRRRRQTVTN
ncbi:MAG: zinc ribbon domain-containing protein [Simkaniaceae bacterium]|nr:zinc ribbon domain-containing protein [Simkaniaceae bacterium]